MTEPRFRPLRFVAALALNFVVCWAVGWLLGPLLQDVGGILAVLLLAVLALLVTLVVSRVVRDWVWAPDQPAPAEEWTEDRL